MARFGLFQVDIIYIHSLKLYNLAQLSSRTDMASDKDFRSDEQFIIEDKTYKPTSRSRADYLWIYRLLMIPTHILGNFWLYHYYGSHTYLQYMSYFSIGFNLMYFIFGFLSIAVSHLKYRGLSTKMFKFWYAIAHPSAWIVTILYWVYIFGLMVPSLDQFVLTTHLFTSIVGHIFNLVLLQFDLFLCTLNLKAKYVIFPLLTFILYELNLIYNVAVKEEKFPYDFIDKNYNSEEGIFIY
jgi:hypothetical protein